MLFCVSKEEPGKCRLVLAKAKWKREQIVKKFFDCTPRAVGRRTSKLLAGAAGMAAIFGLSAVSARASVVLTSGNSSISVNSTAVGSWDVNGTNQLNQEQFFLRTGSSGGQLPLTSLTPSTVTAIGADTAKVTYGSTSGIQLVVTYSLTGGQIGSESSDLTESVKINNDSGSSQTFHLFEYTNFNLDNSTTGQVVTITGGNTATDVGDGFQSQTVVSPKPSEFEASNTATSPDLLAHISSTTTPYTLKNVASAAAGDGEWAFEWDLNIGCGSSAVINIDKSIKAIPVIVVPEPTPGAIAMLGLGGLFVMRPRRGTVAI
jgi:MYXO-CTERM domain-containing protein